MNELVTKRPPLILKEYGRNIQKIVAYLNTIPDRDTRTKYAYSTIELMKQINPAVRDSPESSQKLWDDLYIMSDFTLDIDSPFPMPKRETLFKKPLPVSYNVHRIKYKHYGQNLLLMLKKATEIEDDEERHNMTLFIGKLMKSFYGVWNKENIDDEVIVDNIMELTNGKLQVDLEKIRADHSFDTAQKDKPRQAKPQPKKPFNGNRGKRKS